MKPQTSIFKLESGKGSGKETTNAKNDTYVDPKSELQTKSVKIPSLDPKVTLLVLDRLMVSQGGKVEAAGLPNYIFRLANNKF